MKPDQTAQQSDLGPFVCNIGYQITLVDERADDNCCEYRKTCLKQPLKNRKKKRS